MDTTMIENDLPELFGNIDIYLFDQLLKGRFHPGMRLLDAGCGSGRNLVYFLRNGYDVYGVDQSPAAIAEVRRLASVLAPQLAPDNFRVEKVEQLSFTVRFDAVVSSAVLHFARDEAHWQAMVSELWRVLEPGGIFFARLASSIGIEERITLLEGRRYHLPDGSDRFLVDEEMLRSVTADLGGEFSEPIKTTVVENLRSMTTWVVKKKH
jgi:tellurite methyltransferase